MLHRTFIALAVAGAFCLFVPRGFAQPVEADRAVQPAEVRAWLVRIHDAASHNNFQGTFVVSAGGTVSSARIAHFCEGRNQYERIESLDGPARHVFRHNDVVQTVWPQTHVAVLEQREWLSSFPALLQVGGDRIAEFYALRALGAGRMAGHEANVLLLRPRDAHRFGYRLWAERNSGLLLRADVLGERGEVLETSAFSEVAIGGRAQPEAILEPMKKLNGYRVVRASMKPTSLNAEGWIMHETVPGFREVSCVKRPMDDATDAAPGESAHQAVQAIYSDGLTYVSVFIEPFDPQRHTRAVLSAHGATQTLMRRQGEWWITVVGDVPAITLRAFANGLERKR